MPNYKEMYLTLFRETTKAISILQRAQQTTEEMYIADEENGNLNKANSESSAGKEKRLPQG